MAVTHDEVRQIAALARIQVPDARLDEVARELSGILEHISAISGVAASESGESGAAGAGARNSAHAGVSDALRGMTLAEDVGPPLQLERDPSSFAPDFRDGFFLVPRLATHEAADE